MIDENAAYSDQIFERFFLGENGSNFLVNHKSRKDTISDIMYFDRHTGKNPKYIFSSPNEDIGIIALDDIPLMGRQFVAMLYDKGYRPISLSNIDSNCVIRKNKEILAIGFPSELSELKQYRKNIDSSIYHWQSPYITIPVISKGLVKDYFKDSVYFTGNIFSYHGNSGGPIISNNKLVGINIAYGGSFKHIKNSQLNYYRDETAYFSKSSNILPLLRKLEKNFTPNNQPYIIMKNYRDSSNGIISGGILDFN